MTDNKLFLSYIDIENYCCGIGQEILISNWSPEYIVGLTRGGLLPANLLSQFLEVPMVSLDVSLRDHSELLKESNCWMAEDALDGKKILIVDDINDSGATLEWIINDWKNNNRPKSPEWNNIFGNTVRFAVMVNNEASNFKDVSYLGSTVNKDERDVWVEFPWENWWK